MSLMESPELFFHKREVRAAIISSSHSTSPSIIDARIFYSPEDICPLGLLSLFLFSSSDTAFFLQIGDPNMRRRQMLLLAAALIPVSWAVTCYDCVGQDCMGNFCQGDYCVLSQFRPRWGSIEFGKPKVVKVCAFVFYF